MVQTLSKWSSKIQAVAPSILLPSNRGTFLKGSQQLKSAAQLVDETLVDHEKLLTRTQISRGKKGRIGAPQGVDVPDAADPDIFDDTDFYQKMLRDIIDARGDSNGGEDWMISQKQKKAKKKVDTKASKGRKLRFVNGLTYVVLFLINLYLTGMKLMRSYKALWFQSPFLGHGMMNRLTSCSLRFSGKVLRMWV